MQSLKGFNTVVTAAPRITGATGGGGGGRGGHEGGSCNSLAAIMPPYISVTSND